MPLEGSRVAETRSGAGPAFTIRSRASGGLFNSGCGLLMLSGATRDRAGGVRCKLF